MVRKFETVKLFSEAQLERGAATFDVSGSTGIDQVRRIVFSVMVAVMNRCRTESWEGYYGTETETTYYDAWYEVRLQLEWF